MHSVTASASRAPVNPNSAQYDFVNIPVRTSKARGMQTPYMNQRSNVTHSYAAQQDTQGVNECSDDSDDLEFGDYVRKRTRRFYVGGFKPSITENKIASYVNRRGPTVTKVTIFRNSRYNKCDY